MGWSVVIHPPYSPDLDQSDFRLSGTLKAFLWGTRFSDTEEVKDPIRAWDRGCSQTFFSKALSRSVWKGDANALSATKIILDSDILCANVQCTFVYNFTSQLFLINKLLAHRCYFQYTPFLLAKNVSLPWFEHDFAIWHFHLLSAASLHNISFLIPRALMLFLSLIVFPVSSVPWSLTIIIAIVIIIIVICSSTILCGFWLCSKSQFHSFSYFALALQFLKFSITMSAS